MRGMTLRALTLDLDDTLWPVWPAIERAEALLLDWLRAEAPATGAAHDTGSLRALRVAVEREHPGRAHDFTWLRRESIRAALQAAGDDPALAEPAFEVFFAARQEVRLYDDVLPALDRLAARWPILSLSNGNADVQRIGLGRYFRGSLSARELGIGKPAPQVFHVACDRLGVEPGAVLHIGDDVLLDVDGAHGAGLQAAWVEREGVRHPALPQRAPRHRVADLLRLADALGA